jgi:hypothetical protein
MPRFQIDVSEKKLLTIEELMRLCELPTKKDLFNNALTLFQWAVSEKLNGHTIASIDERTKKYRELQMPALNVAPQVARAAQAGAASAAE